MTDNQGVKKYLSVISDDFGLSGPVNRGIRDAFEHGILTDAALMPNGPAFREAADMARSLGISIAAHVNLVRGDMLTEASFPRTVAGLWRNCVSSGSLLKAEKEARAQIEKILHAGLTINQLNSEKHSHFFPPLFRLWTKLAGEYKIPCVRFIREWSLYPSVQGVKADILSLFSLVNRRRMNEAGVSCADHFLGIRATGTLDAKGLAAMLGRIRPGWTELITHVGYNGDVDPSMGKYFLQESREQELRALTDPAVVALAKAGHIILRNFGGMHDK